MSIYRIYTGADGETPGALALSTCHAEAASLDVVERGCVHGRWFARLDPS